MNEVTLTVANGPLAQPVMRRMTRALGASADLPMDRLEDATLICDAVLSENDHGRTTVRFVARDGGLEIVFAAFPAGGGASARSGELPGIGPIIDRLADEVWIEADRGGAQEHLHVLVGRSGAG